MATNEDGIDLAGLADAARKMEELDRRVFRPIQKAAEWVRYVLAAQENMNNFLRRVARTEVDCLAAEKVRDQKVALLAAEIAAVEANRDRVLAAAREVIERTDAAAREGSAKLAALTTQIHDAEQKLDDFRRLLQQGV
jgi:hypothetical protein